MTSISALKDSSGHPVDWWFIYKLPENASPTDGHSRPSTGYEFLYCDSEDPGSLRLSSNNFSSESSALHLTLAQLDDPKITPGCIYYNDEIPGAKSNDERKGHTKGVLAFDPAADSALWMLHSTPRFPIPGKADFPEDERIYGQTFLCVTLKDMATAEAIAQQMELEQQPQTYGFRIPTELSSTSFLRKLTEGVDTSEKDNPCDIPFFSKGGQAFRLMAKNRLWGKDFWTDWVGPQLGVDLSIETWRRGAIPGDRDSDGRDDVQDVLSVDLSPLGVPYAWSYTKDHAKWAVSTESDWVCVADINRQVSQAKRGGGAICFQQPQLWKALSSIDKLSK